MFWFRKIRQMEEQIKTLNALTNGLQIQLNVAVGQLQVLNDRVVKLSDEVDSADQKVIESKVDEYLDGIDLSDQVETALGSIDLTDQIESALKDMDLTEEVEANLKDFDITSMVNECLEEMDFSEYITEEMMAEAFKTALQGIKETK